MPHRITIPSAILLASLGCKSEVYEVTGVLVDIEKYQIRGSYYPKSGENMIIRFQEHVLITQDRNEMMKQYDIEGSKVVVQMRNSSMEKRSHLEFIITDQGETLLCTACGLYGLDDTWHRGD